MTVEEICQWVCDALAEAYECRKFQPSYLARVAIQEAAKVGEITREEVAAACEYVKLHRAGKLKDQAQIPYSASSAAEGVVKLIQTAQGARKIVEEAKRSPVAGKPREAPWESPDYQEPDEEDFAMLRELRLRMSRIGKGPE